MLHYKGVISEQPGIKVKPIGNSDKEWIETLLFYDDELCDEKSCFLVEDQLQEHFKSEPGVHIQVHYDKEDNRVIIGMTIFFDKEEDIYQSTNLPSKNIIIKHFLTLLNQSIRCIPLFFDLV